MSDNNAFLTYANSFQAVAKPGLANITALLSHLGNPQDALKCIHVAGTNGKGSVCSFLSCMLTASGKRVGKYISPNMIDVTERISVDGEDISHADLERIMERVKDAADLAEKDVGAYPTQFELWTAAAFLYFAERKCGICVIEVGLGGELDATNVIKSPLYSVITSIGMDHMGFLGNTLGEIASAKAGIIKNGCPLVTYDQTPDVMESFNKKCEAVHSRVILAEKPTVKAPEGFCEVIDYGTLKDLKLGISGACQAENASLALAVALDMSLTEEAIRSGLLAAKNPGRFEVLSTSPIRIIDGAHNPDGMAALMDSLKRYIPGIRPTFIMGMMADKDSDAVFEVMKNYGFSPSKIYTVSVKDNPRSDTADGLSEKLLSHGFDAIPCHDLNEALSRTVGAPLTVICGSLYLYKDYSERNK